MVRLDKKKAGGGGLLGGIEGRDKGLELTAKPACANSLCVGSLSQAIWGTFLWGQALVTGYGWVEKGGG